MIYEYETITTKEDYLKFSGIDLDLELTSRTINDIGDNPAPRFIKGIEDWCRLKLTTRPYFWDGVFHSEHQKKCFLEGILYQISYVLKSGNISNDSGYNMATGTLIPREQLENIGMSTNSIFAFTNGGMMNFIRG